MDQKQLQYLVRQLGFERSNLIATYLEEHHCNLIICKPRITKLGDFRIKGKNLSIKVNNNLNKYRFIITLVHEIAHLKTYIEFGLKPKPHGSQWKQNYKQLLLIWKIEELFDATAELRQIINNELNHPKACSGIHIESERSLRSFDQGLRGTVLDEISEGERFSFRNVPYQKLKNRRTRALCLNLINSKKYTIHKAAEVFPIV